MVVVGAGNLGRALALHEEFERRQFRICAIVDSDARKVGRKVGSLTVQGVRDLPTIIKEKDVAIGVIAVPAEAAQAVADIMIASGIKGLLNLALTHVVAPARVSVIDSRIVASVLELTHAIKFRSLRSPPRRSRKGSA
jgi:redox-sensing transcriptional repressor